jgi:two-component system, NarL family, sensor kinase
MIKRLLEKRSFLLIPLTVLVLLTFLAGWISSQQSASLDQATQVNQIIAGSMGFLGAILAVFTLLEIDQLLGRLHQSRLLSEQIQEKERYRIAQELHDGTLQELIALKRHPDFSKLDGIIDQVRRVCYNLKPQVLDDLGLVAAIGFLADELKTFGITTVHMNVDEINLGKLPTELELPLFRIVQELCTNIKKHSTASQVWLVLSYEPEESPVLSGLVTDNGHGFDMQKTNTHNTMGLSGIQERLRQLNGKLAITSSPGKGSQFQFVIPVPKPGSKTITAQHRRQQHA